MQTLWFVFCFPQTVLAAENPKRQATVYCMVSEEKAYPFSAGKDRCFKEINGQKSAYKSATVCAMDTTDGPRLRFMYSVADKATCIEGSPVTKADDYSWGLEMLGKEEKEFFLKHIDTK
ncbi:MAG: hypothetical protein OEW33_02575 [Nitrospirota bacterium]|nr:hypothetical protein [Nitrospirota bacterium]